MSTGRNAVTVGELRADRDRLLAALSYIARRMRDEESIYYGLGKGTQAHELIVDALAHHHGADRKDVAAYLEGDEDVSELEPKGFLPSAAP